MRMARAGRPVKGPCGGGSRRGIFFVPDGVLGLGVSAFSEQVMTQVSAKVLFEPIWHDAAGYTDGGK